MDNKGVLAMKRIKRRKRKFHVVLFILLILLAFGVVLLGTDVFNIKKISVLGNEKLRYNQIIKLSGITQGENIFKIKLGEVVKSIEQNPYIVVDNIYRRLPDEIVIEITERQISYLIPYLGSYIGIDSQGVVLEVVDDTSMIDKPIINRLTISNFSLGEEIAIADPQQGQALKEVMGSIEESGMFEYISEVNLERPDNIIIFSREGIEVIMGDTRNFENKLKWMKIALEDLRQKGNIRGILDVSIDGQAIFKPLEGKGEGNEG